MPNLCKTCRILDPRQNVCQLYRSIVDPEKDFCSKHQTKLDQCENCQKGILSSTLVEDPLGTWHTLCPDCAKSLNTCSFCQESVYCAFETNPSPLPKMVQRQIKSGNMIQIATIKNPERIKITCQNGCKCYSAEYDCMRQYGYCENMNHVWDNREKS